MISKIISKWAGSVEYNNNEINSNFDISNLKGTAHFVFYPNGNDRKPVVSNTDNKVQNVTGTYRISVKSYMTKKATPEFDFMEKFNNNIPMPLMTMVGEKVKETKGMVYVKLHGDITSKITERCLCCGKPITNPISKYFGMGPVCGGHNYTNPFDTEEELKQAVEVYRKKLQSMTWEGWIIKSAITEEVAL
ncbi:MAG: hypothetical protein J6Y78_15230 [Paludibacteraceae bacterium]|nr:hypothetical protein [Paludibacteraceae bacterium]